MSKGSWQRLMNAADKKKFDDNYDRIFGPKKLNNMEGGDLSTEVGVEPRLVKKDAEESVSFAPEDLLT